MHKIKVGGNITLEIKNQLLLVLHQLYEADDFNDRFRKVEIKLPVTLNIMK